MKNVDRLLKRIQKHKSNNILIHSIPGTQNWIVAEKSDDNRWQLSLMNPMKNIIFNLGDIDNKNHIQLWEEIVTMTLENRRNQAALAKQLRYKVKNFLNPDKDYHYQFIKKHAR